MKTVAKKGLFMIGNFRNRSIKASAYRWLLMLNGIALIGNSTALGATRLRFSSATYSVLENGGVATIRVGRSGNPHGACSVNFTTSDGTATAGLDYTATTGTIVFASGQRTKTFTVSVLDDLLIEGNETVNLTLSGVTGASLSSPKTAVVTIIDNEGNSTPNLSVHDIAALEGNSGTTPFVFHVTLSPASTNIVTVLYATADDSALAGSDYVAQSGTLTFNPGEKDKTITVQVNGDTINEPNVDFFVDLSNPVNATLAPAEAVGTIINDDGPTVLDDNYTTTQNTPLIVSAPGVLVNDTDVKTNSLTAILSTGAANGTVTLNPDGSFTYTPNSGFTGTDSFTYHANDGSKDSIDATATITVGVTNSPPVAVDDGYSTNENTPLFVATPGVTGNDTDADGDPLTTVLVGLPTHGVVTLNDDGSFLYTPDTDYVGTDTFTYQVNDGLADSNVGTVTITVNFVDQAPVAADDSYFTGTNATLTVPAPGVLANDTDADGDPLTAILVSSTTNGTVILNPDGSFTYSPTNNFIGIDTFTYKANDGLDDSNVGTVTITVSPVDAGDAQLYAKSASFGVNWAVTNRDLFKIVGKLNPRGAKADLTGATMQVSINGTNVSAPVTLDSAGLGSVTAGSAKIKARFSGATGLYSFSITGGDLASAISLPNTTGSGLQMLDVTLTINGASLDIPAVTGELEALYVTTAGKSSKGKFAYKTNRTMTGVYNWNKTGVGQLKDGKFRITASGVIEASGGNAVIPTGNTRVTIGGSVFTIPDPNVKFALIGTSRSFKISANELSGTGIPASGNGAATSYELPITFEVPTAGGTNVYQTVIEIKRLVGTSTKWLR
jgi:VCBS repeat-containing protein